MHRYQFQLHISSDEYLDYYRGAVRSVVVQATTGQTIQFPANLLQKFISTEGIHGDFELTCDNNHKCVGLQRVG
jgi:hypothetical protein